MRRRNQRNLMSEREDRVALALKMEGVVLPELVRTGAIQRSGAACGWNALKYF